MAYALLIEGACAARRAKRWSGTSCTLGSGSPRALSGGAALLAALLALAAAGCFTGPINRPPEITVDGPRTPPRKQLEPEFYTATASDPDGDQPKVMWYVDHNLCSDANDRASWPAAINWFSSTPDPDKLMLDGSDIDGLFCVWAFATDSRGAVRAANFVVQPQDQPPIANIRVVAPNPSPSITTAVLYPLYSTIELSSDRSSDPEGDDLQWTWTLDAPGGSKATLIGCNGADQCFTADLPGNYLVTLVASDPANKTNMTTREIAVNGDQPPCIQRTMPDFQLTTPIALPARDPYTIMVNTVADDGNPTPAGPMGRTFFRWFISTNGGPFVPDYYNDVNQLTLVGYKLGDLVKVRAEATDGQAATESAIVGCGSDKDTCPSPAGCGGYLRVSWSIQY